MKDDGTQGRIVYPFVDPTTSYSENLQWRYFFSDGTETSKNEYDHFADYMDHLDYGGQEKLETNLKYEDGDTE